MDSKFWQDIIVALLTFSLGLLTAPISRLFQRPKKHLTYFIKEQIVIAASDLLPAIQSKLPNISAENIVQYTIGASNTGAQTIKDATVLIVPETGIELLQTDVTTIPPRMSVKKCEGKIDREEMVISRCLLPGGSKPQTVKNTKPSLWESKVFPAQATR